MKKFVALLMAIALLCTSMVSFATEEVVVEEPVVVVEENTADEEEEKPVVDETHKHTPSTDEPEVVTEPDCDTDGEGKFVCSVCEEEYVVVLPALGHEKKTVTAIDDQQPTHFVEGWLKWECKVCGEDIFETLPVTDHVTKTEVIPADCVTPEKTVTTCTIEGCDYKAVEETGKAKGHTFTKKGDENATSYVCVPATCKEDGYEGDFYFCTRCGAYSVENYNNITVLDEFDHEFEKYMVIGEAHDDFGYPIYDEEGEVVKVYTGINTKLLKGNSGVIEAETDTAILPGPNGEAVEKEVEVTGDIAWTYTAPTCTTDGSATFKCELCGQEATFVVPATNHLVDIADLEQPDFDKIFGASQAPEGYDCTKGGAVYIKCEYYDVCGFEYQHIIGGRPHTYDKEDGSNSKYFQKKWGDVAAKEYALEDIAPCTEYTEICYCIYCDKTDVEGVVEHKAEVDHEPNKSDKNSVIIEKAPTCTEAGEKLFNCKWCGKPHYEVVDALGHTWEPESIQKPASCFEDGVMNMVCSVCGETSTDVIPAYGAHTSVVVTEVKGTCEKEGSYEEKCVACGVVIVEKHSTGYKHNSKGAEIISKENPTCSEDGHKTYVCVDCCEVVREVLPATGNHKYKAGTPVPNTCTEDGYTPYTCSQCGKVENKDIVKAPGHKYVDYVLEVLPTCTTAGQIAYECSVCKTLYARETIPAAGHVYQTYYDAKTGKYVTICECEHGSDCEDCVAYTVEWKLPNKKTIEIEVAYCGAEREIKVNGFGYDVEFSGNKGQIKVKEHHTVLPDAYVVVYCSYTLKSGEDYTFSTVIKVGDDGKFFAYAPAPAGATFDGMYIAVVDSAERVTDSFGELVVDNYGAKSIAG